MNRLETLKELIIIRKRVRDLAYQTNNKQLKIDLLVCIKNLRFAMEKYREGDKDMNKNRRMRLIEARALLEQANDIINDVMNEEDNAYNNLSEGLQQTMRGEQMEENVGEMEEAIDNIEGAIDNLNNIE